MRPMDPSLEDAFRMVAHDAISNAEEIECSGADYRRGIKLIIAELHEHLADAAVTRGLDEDEDHD